MGRSTLISLNTTQAHIQTPSRMNKLLMLAFLVTLMGLMATAAPQEEVEEHELEDMDEDESNCKLCLSKEEHRGEAPPQQIQPQLELQHQLCPRPLRQRKGERRRRKTKATTTTTTTTHPKIGGETRTMQHQKTRIEQRTTNKEKTQDVQNQYTFAQPFFLYLS